VPLFDTLHVILRLFCWPYCLVTSVFGREDMDLIDPVPLIFFWVSYKTWHFLSVSVTSFVHFGLTGWILYPKIKNSVVCPDTLRLLFRLKILTVPESIFQNGRTNIYWVGNFSFEMKLILVSLEGLFACSLCLLSRPNGFRADRPSRMERDDWSIVSNRCLEGVSVTVVTPTDSKRTISQEFPTLLSVYLLFLSQLSLHR
jgi:hypothetical protein